MAANVLSPADQMPIDTPALWMRAPAEAHRLWRESLRLADRAYAEHSTAQYRAQFGRFCEWMAGRGLNLQQLTAAQIQSFLATLEGRGGAAASTRTHRMYLAEIDRVMGRLVELEIRKTRATEQLLEKARTDKTLRLAPRHVQLPDVGADLKIQEYIETLLARDPGMDAMDPRSIMISAMVSLMLQGGVTPKEIQKLHLSALRNGVLERYPLAVVHVPGHRILKERDVELTGWAAASIRRWWQLRRAVLATAAPGGRRRADDAAVAFALTVSGRAVTSKFMYQAVTSFCAAAGASEDAGPQLLRNLFLARMLRDGVPQHEIAARAGLRALNQLQHVKDAMRQQKVPQVNPD